MDIGRGAASDAKYLSTPKIGSPDIEGDLTNATITNPSGARSITLEDIELVAKIKSDNDRRNAMEYCAQETEKQDWYTNIFSLNFMNEEKPIPTNNVKIPTLTQGLVDNKPLYTYYGIHYTYFKIPFKLRIHIFKPDYYWIAGRYVSSKNPSYSGFRVRGVNSVDVGGNDVCDGIFGAFNKYSRNGFVRPVVVLQSGVQLIEYIESGYNWKVDQN